MAALALVHPATLLPFGVVHRNAALAPLHEHHEPHDGYSECGDHQQRDDVDITLACRFEGLPDGGWEP